MSRLPHDRHVQVFSRLPEDVKTFRRVDNWTWGYSSGLRHVTHRGGRGLHTVASDAHLDILAASRALRYHGRALAARLVAALEDRVLGAVLADAAQQRLLQPRQLHLGHGLLSRH
jgi:hypothetical protein